MAANERMNGSYTIDLLALGKMETLIGLRVLCLLLFVWVNQPSRLGNKAQSIGKLSFYTTTQKSSGSRGT